MMPVGYGGLKNRQEEVKNEMKSEKIKTKAMALAICVVLLVSFSGVSAASTQNVSEDVSNVVANLDYIMFDNTKKESLIQSEVESKATGCEIKYDDGTAEVGFTGIVSGLAFAVHFTNTCPTTTLKTARFYIPKYPASFDWKILKWTESKPGSVIASGTTTPTKTGWHDVDVGGITVPTDFVIALYQTSAYKPYLGADEDMPIEDRSWYCAYGIWYKFSYLVYPDEYDLMIRAVMEEVAEPKLCTDPDPPSYDFDGVPVGETRTWTFDIKNCGAVTLTWSISDDQPWITVSPTSGTTTTETDTVTVKIDTTGLSLGEHTGTISITSDGGDKTGTINVTVLPPPEPEVSISTDKFKYCPCETMLITIDISNPTDSPVIYKLFVGAPTKKVWKPIDKKELPAGYEDTMEIKLHVGEWGATPFGIVWYADLEDSKTGQVLAANSTCCAYCTCEKAIPPMLEEDIAAEIGEELEGIA